MGKLGRMLAIVATMSAPAYSACLLSIDDSLVANNMSDATSCEAGTSHYASTIMCDRPLAYWRLGETTIGTAAKDEKGTYPGAYSGNVSLGKSGAISHDTNTAVGFDANDDTHVSAPGSNLLFHDNAPMSLEAWIRPRSLDGTYFCPLSSDGDDTSGKRQGYVLCASTTYGISIERYHDSMEEQLATQNSLGSTLDVYRYVVATYDGSTLSLYVNASSYGSIGSTASIGGHQAVFTIGSLADGSFGFTGDIDEVAVYPYALSEKQIAAHFAAGTN